MSRNARVLGALLTPVVTVPVAAQAAHAYDPPAPPKGGDPLDGHLWGMRLIHANAAQRVSPLP